MSRNINRINNEIKVYNYKPFFNPSYILTETHFRMQKQMDNLIINFENCDKKKLNCDSNLQPKVSKKLGYYILNKK